MSENSIDQGIAAQASLLAALVSGRMQLGLHASVERDLINEVGATMVASLENRERALTTHERLAGFAKRLGLDPTGFGDGGDKDVIAALPSNPELSIVGEERRAA